MAELMKRQPLQGVWTVVRFNWHRHVCALLLAFLLLVGSRIEHELASLLAMTAGLGIMGSVVISLIATWWAYDASGLYELNWLRPNLSNACHAAHIHAGFDELSGLLKYQFPKTSWQVFDFYDPEKHTEISIRRARQACASARGTVCVDTHALPLPDASLDRVLLFLAAHEVRSHEERVIFFREIRRVLNDKGKVIITEHLRDAANIAAYSVGAWHFHTRSEWLQTFTEAGFRIASTIQNHCLITTFVLEPS